ncbi:MAG: tetratricopeptide repeat protein [Phycisphaerae bacterium]
MTRHRPRRFDPSALVVAAVCLVFQLIYLAEGWKDPTFTVPVVDAGVYHDQAVRFAGGGRLLDDAFWQPPLFPLLLGCLYRLVGVNILLAKVALAALSVASCVLMWWIGRRVFSRRAAIVAGLTLTVYGPFLFFSTQLLPTGLAVFLDLVALLLWLRCLERSRWHRWLAFGLAVGAATITVPNAGVLLVIAVIGLVMSGVRHRRWQPVLVAGSMTLLGTAIPIGSVTVRNYLVSDEWVLISTNGGINFYIGNNPQSDETVAIRPGEQWRRLARETCHEGAWTRAEQNACFFRRGLAYPADRPLDFLRGLGRKAIRLVNAREIPRNVDPYVFRDFSFLLSTFLWRAGPFGFPFGLIAPLAAVGVLASLRSSQTGDAQRAGRFALLAFIVAYGASIVLFFVSARHRLPAAVVMIPFAAAGACWVWEPIWDRACRGMNGLRRRTAAVAFATAAILVNAPTTAPTDGVNFRAELAMSVGHAYAVLGKFEEAEGYLRQALQLDPQYAGAAGKLAGVLVEQGELEEAERLLHQAVTWDDQSTPARQLLGELLRRRGRPTEAIAMLEEALAIDATSPETRAGLADVLVETGRIDEAIEHYRNAVDFADEPGDLLIRLADALVQTEAYEEAIERYRQALWRVDPDPTTLNRVAWLLATCPVAELRDCERAIEIAEHLCRITDYSHPVALDTLAAAYAECGRWAEAVKWVRRAIDTALADNDPATADSFRLRLETYEARLKNRE